MYKISYTAPKIVTSELTYYTKSRIRCEVLYLWKKQEQCEDNLTLSTLH